ncbi:TetR/AcrR family transcriptional regulator C-terminal domain-containing protein [Aldersonia kunmingensis]|uniref:TetR/AcrR family transcriptional regulator C-terminal domain-containing protein n=1 Tax=Aldersonia kunmingensis TaxID=408066 RepID=UPI00082F4FB0|nr:TetR/AcrR family transcriptional regulator C-terminal domain-containing protein [Aldersonia kunmingensis]
MREVPAQKRGRPRRIDIQMITQAVLEIGPTNATMRRVAEHIGVSLPGLYHHVKNQDELLALVARHTLQSSPPPRYEGQHWAVWLRSYASYIRTALVAEPTLLEKFISDGVEYDGEMANVGEALDGLHAQGLAPADALDVYSAVVEMALGAVSEAHREYVHRQKGQPWFARIFSLTAQAAPEDYPTLRAIGKAGYDPFEDEAFQRRITLLLRGIEAQHGLPPEPVQRPQRSPRKPQK